MISVVMPVFNASRFVAAAVESILTQTVSHFEFLIIDDGSTDGTLSIVRAYANRDKRIRILVQENQGISRTLNRGIQEARNEWIAIMHADDIACPTRFEKQVGAAIANPHVVAWGAYAFHLSQRGRILSVSKVGPVTEEDFSTLRRKGDPILIIHPTAFMRRETVIRAGGYDSQFEASEDLELFDRLAEFGPILTIPEPLVQYRIHGSSNTMTRFFESRAYTRFVKSRQRARATGQTPQTWDEFIRVHERAPLLKLVRRRVDDLSQYYYRRFAVAVSSEQYWNAVRLFAVSALLNPRYALPRAWNQRFADPSRALMRLRRGR
jgi:glycosyltransferase involved in cell wall biosynthesis